MSQQAKKKFILPPSPLQKVAKQFGSRAALVDQLVPLVDRGADDSDQSVRSRLMGLSNTRLLRLWNVEQKVREQFGSKDALLDKLIEARKAAGHSSLDAVREKLSGYTKARLLDMTRQNFAPALDKIEAPKGSKERTKARRARR